MNRETSIADREIAEDCSVKCVVILSPHSDDAALSLPSTIACCQQSGLAVKVLTCFSRSNWATQLQGKADTETVSRIRQQEDLDFARSAGVLVQVISLGLDDFPLRRPGEISPILNEEPPDDLVAELVGAIQPHLAQAYILAPLGLGKHIDHCAVTAASIRLADYRPLAFYEEVPYRLSLNDDEIKLKIGQIVSGLGISVRPILITRADRIELLYRAISCYSSQFSEGERRQLGERMSLIAGERLWITDHPGAEAVEDQLRAQQAVD